MSRWLTTTMFGAAASWGFLTLADATLKATCLLILALGATGLLHRRGATLRHFAWVSVFAVLLALPLLTLALPQWHVLPDWFGLSAAESLAGGETPTPAARNIPPNAPQKVEPAGMKETTRDTEVTAPSLANVPPSESSASVPVAVAEDSAAEPAGALLAAPAETASPSPERISSEARRWLVVAWLVGCLVAISRLLLSAFFLRRTRSRAVEVTGGPLYDEFDGLRRELGLTRPVRLVAADDAAMPMVWGIRRACVLVPQSIENWPESQRRAVLLHELGHVARRDPLWHLLVECVKALYWFHPLVWLAARRAHVERERACDDLVLNRGVPASDYARHLLEVVSGGRLRRVGPAVGVAMASTSKLEGRVRSILDEKTDRRPLTGWIVLAGLVAAFSIGLPVAMMRAGEAERSEDAPAKSDDTDESNSEAPPRAAVANKPAATAEKADPEEEKNEPYTHPISVSGRALDAEGKPIAGARIFLSSQKADWKRLAETKTDKEGRYVFKDVDLPIQRARTNAADDLGAFEVFGLAEGYAFAWRPRKWYYPEPKEINWDDNGDPHEDWPKHFSGDEKIELDLTFREPTSLKGRIVDDLGSPIPNTEIDIRYCDPKWNKEDFHRTRLIGAFSSLNERNIVPREKKVARTDEQGRFELKGLPRDCRFGLWIRPPGFPLRRIYAVTHPGVTQDGKGHRVYSGEINLTFDRPVEVPFRVLFDDTGKPAPKVYVGANSDSGSKSGDTDENGNTTIGLAPGEYLVRVLPRTGTDYWITQTKIEVDREPLEEPHVIRLRPAAVVEVTVVDAQTGRGIPDVDFWKEVTFVDERGEVHRRRDIHHFRSLDVETRVSHVHRPRTDKTGRLKALFEPGEYTVGVALRAFPEEYEVVEADGKKIECEAGKTVKLTFHMRRKEPLPEKEAAIEKEKARAAARAEAAQRAQQELEAALKLLDSRLRAVKFLESQQKDDGSWRMPNESPHEDGLSALCTLALLESGRTVKDASVRRSLARLGKLKLDDTYSVALQTVVLAAADAKRYRTAIARNAKWLSGAQRASGAWSYRDDDTDRGDGSNASYATWGLDAARRAGAKIEEKVWKDAASYWLESQHADGSWGYMPGTQSTPNMTLSGIASLLRASRALDDEQRGERIKSATERAWKWFAQQDAAKDPFSQKSWKFYGLHAYAEAASAGKASKDAYSSKIELVLKRQNRRGGWTSDSVESPLIATSFALLFLSAADDAPQAAKNEKGSIRWIDRDTQTAWINLGVEDGVKRRSDYRVLPKADETAVGRVTVVRILGPHLSEVRILDDDSQRPIQVGFRVRLEK